MILEPGVRDVLRPLVAAVGGSDDIHETSAVNAILEKWFDELGFDLVRHSVPGRADLLVAELAVGPAGGEIAPIEVTVIGHSDTVWPAGFDPEWVFTEDPEAGLVSGPGVGDMKAGLVIAGLAARTAARLCTAPGLIRVMVIPDEEVGSLGSLPWIEQYVGRTDLCIGLEAGKPGDGFVGSRGAVGAMRVTATGVAAHVTEPGGINALDALVPLAAGVQSLAGDAALISVCRFHGGYSRQVVADHGYFEIDLRADHAEGMRAAVADVREAARRAALGFAGGIEVSGGMTRPAFPPQASREPWRVLEEIDAARARAAGAPHTASSTTHQVHERGGSDASFFAAAGVPTLDGFGAICWDNCARGERVETASIADRAERMAALAATWINDGRRRSR